MTERAKNDLKILDEFLIGKIGIASSELIGYVATFKKDTEVSMRVTTSSKCSIDVNTEIKAGTEIRVLRSCFCNDHKFGSVHDYVVFEITNPQIVIEQFDISIKQFIEAIA